MRIQHNIMAMNAYRNYNRNTSALSKNLERLSSGYKINRAGDDAAGLAISEKMRAQITGLEAAQKNVKDGISLVNTAEGAMQEVQDMLNRMVYLAQQSANGTYDDAVDRANLQKEMDQLNDEIDRIADSANFNGIKLLNGNLDADGMPTTVKGSDRIIPTVWNGTGDPSAVTGKQTIVDGAPATEDVKTVFEMDFSDLKAVAGAGGAGGATYTPGAAVDGVTATVDADTATAGDVKVSINTAAANVAATATGTGDLADLTFGAGATDNAAANGYKIIIEKTGNAGDEAATIDDAAKTITLKLATDGGTAGTYSATDLQTLIQAATGGTGVTAGDLTITGTGTIDATAGGAGAVGEVTLDGGAATGDTVVTLTSGAGEYKETIEAANWTGTVEVDGTAANGVKVSIDTADGGLKTDGTESTLGTVTDAAGGGAAADTITTTVTLGGQAIAEDVELDADDDAAAIAEKVFVKMGGTVGATLEDFALNGVKYDVELNGKTLKFTLKDDPTADNIKGNFDWNVEVEGGKYEGNHTAGTNVVTAGSVASAGARANTVFELTTDDMKDGTKITIDGKTVTLSVGANSKVEAGEGVVKLTDAEAADIDLALSKISEGFGGGTTNFEISVNDGSNDDAKVGIAVYKKAASTEKYTTKEDLAAVFSMEKPGQGAGTALTLQIGDSSDSYNQLKVSIGDIHAEKLGLRDISIAKQQDAADAVDVIKNAINTISSIRGTLGATSNRLDHTANNLSVMRENIQDAESSIRDTDIAEEMMSYTKNNILVQSAQAMLAQANQVPQGVLQLLQ